MGNNCCGSGNFLFFLKGDGIRIQYDMGSITRNKIMIYRSQKVIGLQQNYHIEIFQSAIHKSILWTGDAESQSELDNKKRSGICVWGSHGCDSDSLIEP